MIFEASERARMSVSIFTLGKKFHFIEECEKEIPKNKVIHKLIRTLRITAEISYLRRFFAFMGKL